MIRWINSHRSRRGGGPANFFTDVGLKRRVQSMAVTHDPLLFGFECVFHCQSTVHATSANPSEGGEDVEMHSGNRKLSSGYQGSREQVETEREKRWKITESSWISQMMWNSVILRNIYCFWSFMLAPVSLSGNEWCTAPELHCFQTMHRSLDVFLNFSGGAVDKMSGHSCSCLNKWNSVGLSCFLLGSSKVEPQLTVGYRHPVPVGSRFLRGIPDRITARCLVSYARAICSDRVERLTRA